ncbi:MAG: 50S ribosomal protein L11 methyltransferase [Litorimonas sp.]
MTNTPSPPPFGLFIRSHKSNAFDIADALGFQDNMDALSVSIFDDGPDTMAIQALFETEGQAMACFNAREFDKAMQDSDLKNGAVESFVAQLPDEDWVSLSQAGLPPVPAGRFFVYGSHDADKIPASVQHPIEINAGLAFGTGHHGTTRGCLLIFDNLLEQGFSKSRILDLGCGAGILAIAAAKALNTSILATDIDPDAKMVTQQNAAINSVTPLVEAHIADGFETPILKDKVFDLIFANILAGPLTELAPQISTALAPKAYVILSGILDDQANWVAKAFSGQGLNVTPQQSLKGWTSLLAQKP